jgi:hypothetical protein
MAKRTKKELKPIPVSVMHKPAVMAWAELTTMREHKERQNKDVVVVNLTGKELLSITRATTELRRAYPYLFEFAAYVKTHYPQKIETAGVYHSITVPASVFWDIALDGKEEQKEYLRKEMYDLLEGNSKAKYIKVSEQTTVFARPIVIALIHTEPKTNKEKRITNIGKDKMVDKIQILILKEFLNLEHGYVNLPKAFYAKVRYIYNVLQKDTEKLMEKISGKEYWEAINIAKDHLSFANIAGKRIQYNEVPTTEQTVYRINEYQEQYKLLEELEQGGFHALYLALEYILVNRKKNIPQQTYSLLKICEKCKPDIIYVENGVYHFHSKKERGAFAAILCIFLRSPEELGIHDIIPDKAEMKPKDGNDLEIIVYFNSYKA